VLDAIDRPDARVIEGREHPRLAFEARNALRVARKGRWKNLDRDVTMQRGVPPVIDLAHPAGSESTVNRVRPDAAADQSDLVGCFARFLRHGLQDILGARCLGEQRVDLATQFRVVATGVGDECRSQMLVPRQG